MVTLGESSSEAQSLQRYSKQEAEPPYVMSKESWPPRPNICIIHTVKRMLLQHWVQLIITFPCRSAFLIFFFSLEKSLKLSSNLAEPIIKPTHWGLMANMSFTIVVRMLPLQTAKKITNVILLSLPSGVGPATMQAPSNRSISHNSRKP